jgi:hypothetical protein
MKRSKITHYLWNYMYEAKLLWQEVKITHYIVKLHVRALCESAVVDGGVDNGSGVAWSRTSSIGPLFIFCMSHSFYAMDFYVLIWFSCSLAGRWSCGKHRATNACKHGFIYLFITVNMFIVERWFLCDYLTLLMPFECLSLI